MPSDDFESVSLGDESPGPSSPPRKTPAEKKKRKRKRQNEIKKAKKEIVQEAFNDLVQHLHSILPRKPHAGTDGDELDRFCRKYFEGDFKGVFAANTHPEDMSKGYYIINTDPFQLPGTHWTAVADGLFYDSFDRKSTKLFPEVTLHGTGKSSKTRQKISESNCGERCIAFLVCFKEFGAAAAQKFL
jgi:hypothetical protein